MDEALRALNRFGLGARLGEPARVGDPRAWLLDQLRPEAAALDGGGVPTPGEIAEAIEVAREARGSMDREASAAARRGLARILSRETAAVLDRRVRTDAPFVERLVSFWSNHLCVSVAGKQPLIPLAGAYEREVIRPHVLGRFEYLVLASARHPAMLLYLDNFQSIGPRSRAARAAQRRAGRERGLNENYARELLELHTSGWMAVTRRRMSRRPLEFSPAGPSKEPGPPRPAPGRAPFPTGTDPVRMIGTRGLRWRVRMKTPERSCSDPCCKSRARSDCWAESTAPAAPRKGNRRSVSSAPTPGPRTSWREGLLVTS